MEALFLGAALLLMLFLAIVIAYEVEKQKPGGVTPRHKPPIRSATNGKPINFSARMIAQEVKRQKRSGGYQAINPAFASPPSPPVRPPQKAPPPPLSIPKFDSRPYGFSRDITPLYEKLVRLTRSKETAHRLLQSISENNPGRSVQWVIEKAIFDLERDRGRY